MTLALWGPRVEAPSSFFPSARPFFADLDGPGKKEQDDGFEAGMSPIWRAHKSAQARNRGLGRVNHILGGSHPILKKIGLQPLW
ncbi:MAG: hypothetical protein ACRECD_13075 [Burkholderiaceae bacterium]